MTAQLHRLFPDETSAAAPVGDFDAVWAIWPRREKKMLAKAKYDAILKGCKSRTFEKDSGQFVELELQATHERILAGVKRYLESQKAKGSGSFGYVDGGKWIPYLSTFLNGGRWEDWL